MTPNDDAIASGCRVCGGGPGAPFAHKDGYRFARCGQCGFVYLDPMPTAETLAALYDGGRGGGISADAYPKAASRFRRARIRALRFLPSLRGRDALDIGCGGGFMVEAMARFGARAVGVDIDAQAIGHRRVPDDITAWDMFSPPAHLQFFDRATIATLFERHGFRLRRRYFKLKPGLQILAERA